MTSLLWLRCAVALLALAVLPTGSANAASLKFDVVDRANWGGEKAAAIPRSVEETYAYDAASDTVTVTVKFDRKGFAPLPPMLALAARYGFPAEFGATPADAGAVSVLGPLLGFQDADGYSWRVRGLGRYVLERPVLGSGAAPPELQEELEAEVAKVVAAGHLAPWLFLVNVPGSGWDNRGDVYWHQPGETLYLLAEIVPLLRPETAKTLRGYLRAEREAWPPETRSSVPFADGARREHFGPDEKPLRQWDEKVLGWRTRRPPDAWSLYGLARYYEAVGERPARGVMEKCNQVVARSQEFRDWATLYYLRGHTPEFNAVHGVNRQFAGLVGYVRLARMAGDTDAEALGWGLLARTAALRFAMGKYTQYMQDAHLFNVNYELHENRGSHKLGPEDRTIKAETDPARFVLPQDPAWWAKLRRNDWMGDLVTWNWSRPIDNVRQVHRLDETGVDVWEWCGTDCVGTGQKRDVALEKEYWYMRTAPYLLLWRDITPELGRFMADRLRPEVEAMAGRVVENQPHWHVAYAEAILGAEQGFNNPCDAYGHFAARAWVLGEKPETLRRYIDVPWLPRGDLYYMHKLAETIKACRGVTWAPPR
ncbi:MAG: hypothetical protein IMZ65_03140 [Planctomycetes bacterium]|nr:hypothetical protein [Planctomycetota bacterium]